MSVGSVILETVESEVLRSNPLGDPYVRQVPIYIPPGYENSSAHYPTVYILTGFAGRGMMLLNDKAWEETIARRMDRLIATKAVQPMIIIMPDCFTRIGGSQYLNSPAVGRYEDHVVQELVPLVDHKYRTIAKRNQRAIVGKSSGGYGSVILAMRHPDIFGLMACHSGDMYFEYCYKPDIIKCITAINKFGGLDKFWDNIPNIRPKDRDFGNVLNVIAMAACYSPNPNAQHGFDLPFDPETGELRADVWSRWLEWDPVFLVDKHIDNLRSLQLIYLDAGTRDEFNLQYSARIFCARLKKYGIRYTYEEFDDGHFDIQYRYDCSLKAISERIVG